MRKITASEIVRAISLLPRDRSYVYVNPRTSTRVQIVGIQEPEGPIYIKRYNPNSGQPSGQSRTTTISTQMIWRIANALSEGIPINFDRILAGSYNTRSAFEALLAHTPEFHFCYPGRIEIMNSTTDIRQGHKHIIWLPDRLHEQGILNRIETEIVISEFSAEAVYEALQLPERMVDHELGIEVSRRHAQIQIALVMIGLQLGFRTWVAQNDRGIIYKNQHLGQMEGVLSSLEDVQLLRSFSEAARAALMIDCIWFRNSRFMPAVIEIEHSTGVTSGLTRMKNFYDQGPPLRDVRWTIVAPDEDRDKVMREANKQQFQDLEPKFFPYSAVEELFSLCQRRKVQGVNDNFLDCFMESCLEAA